VVSVRVTVGVAGSAVPAGHTVTASSVVPVPEACTRTASSVPGV
jgi:hypothetical protein